MYKVAVSLIILFGLATGGRAQDLVIEQDSAGEMAGHYESLDAGFRAAIDPGGVTVAEITVNSKVFSVRLQAGRIQELEIVPLRPTARRLKSHVDSERLAEPFASTPAVR